MSSLKKKTISGTLWTVFGLGTSQGLRFVGNIILTRLLVPEMFGLMSLVNTFITGLNLFSDIGLKPGIIRSKRGDDPLFVNTAWTLMVLRGFALWICCLVITWPLANFYEDSRLLWIVPVAGLTTIVSGLSSTSLATLNRKLQIGKLTRLDLCTQTISLIVMIVWAYFRQTIWALLGGKLVSTCIKTIWSHRLDPTIKNRLAWDKDAIHELLIFGRWIFVSTVMVFLASQSDRLILGKIFSLETLGIYTVAFTFADIPRQVVYAISGNVIFPVVSHYKHLSRQELHKKILSKYKLVLIVSAVILTFTFSFGDLIILKLYDNRYRDAGWMMPILALGIWPIILFRIQNAILLALGQSIYGACGNGLKFLYMIIFIPLAFKFFGMLGVIIAIAINDLPEYGVVVYGMWREKISFVQQDLQGTMLLIAFIIIICALRYYLGFGWPLDLVYSQTI